MTFAELFLPVSVVINWMKTTPIVLGGISFTFWDSFIWTMFAGIVIYWLKKIID